MWWAAIGYRRVIHASRVAGGTPTAPPSSDALTPHPAYVCMYVNIRRHQHTRSTLTCAHRPTPARQSFGVSQTNITALLPRAGTPRTQTTIGSPSKQVPSLCSLCSSLACFIMLYSLVASSSRVPPPVGIWLQPGSCAQHRYPPSPPRLGSGP